MPYTLENFQKDYVKNHLDLLSSEDRLQGLSSEDRLQGLSSQDRLQGLSSEDRLKGLSLEEIREYLKRMEKPDGIETPKPKKL